MRPGKHRLGNKTILKASFKQVMVERMEVGSADSTGPFLGPAPFKASVELEAHSVPGSVSLMLLFDVEHF